MFDIKRVLTAIAIAAAISLPAITAAQAKCGHDKPAHQRTIYNAVPAPATTVGSPAGDETKMFIPPPLDPNFHGSNGG